MTITQKNVYQTDDGTQFDTLVKAQNYGKTIVHNQLLGAYLALPEFAQLTEHQKTLLTNAIRTWEKQRPTDAEIQAMIDAVNQQGA